MPPSQKTVSRILRGPRFRRGGILLIRGIGQALARRDELAVKDSALMLRYNGAGKTHVPVKGDDGMEPAPRLFKCNPNIRVKY